MSGIRLMLSLNRSYKHTIQEDKRSSCEVFSSDEYYFILQVDLFELLFYFDDTLGHLMWWEEQKRFFFNVIMFRTVCFSQTMEQLITGTHLVEKSLTFVDYNLYFIGIWWLYFQHVTTFMGLQHRFLGKCVQNCSNDLLTTTWIHLLTRTVT